MRDRLHHCARVFIGSARRRCVRVAVLVACGAGVTTPLALRAQSIPNIKAPIDAAHRAADATSERIAAQTGQALPGRTGARAPVSGPGSAPAGRGVVGAQSPAMVATVAPGAMQPVTREIFGYETESRRDPFFSLILTEDLRPLLSDLKLVGILYATSGRGSVAIMRDILTNAQYRVNAGQTLGRMRVAQIKPRAVIFTIDEFGLSRQDSLFLVDSNKVRIR